MEFKGTKGKWKVVEATPVNNQNIQIKTENLISVIDMDKETVAICGRKEPIQIANAKLIAAAPEMFEMLQKIVLMTETCEGTFMDFRERYNTDIRELLTKITQ